jgi:phosphonate transport system permease protein
MEKGRMWKVVKAFLFDCFFGIYSVFMVLLLAKSLDPTTETDKLLPEAKHLVATVPLGIAIGLLSTFFRPLSLGKLIQGLHSRRSLSQWQRWVNTGWILILLVVTFWGGAEISEVGLRDFFYEPGLAGMFRIFKGLLSPNWDILPHVLLEALITIFMALMATVFAIPVAFVLSFFAANNLMKGHWISGMVYGLTRFVLNMTRSIEPLIWAIVFSVWVGIGPFAGMLALALHSIASLAKLYSEQIENIDEGPMEAITATGAHPVQVIWFGVVPQIVLPFLSFTIYRWDINVRMATIIGLVGGGGLGKLLMQYTGLAMWNEVGLIVIVIAVIVWVMDYASAKIREAIK